MSKSPFKVCPMCSKKWDRLDAFLADPTVNLKGYQANFDSLEEGLFYFVHNDEGCGTTMAIPVKAVKKLSDLPLLAPSAGHPPKGCKGLCLNEHDLSNCPETCNCKWVRDIMQTIRNWKKNVA